VTILSTLTIGQGEFEGDGWVGKIGGGQGESPSIYKYVTLIP